MQVSTEAPQTALLACDNITKQFDGHVLFQNLNLSIAAGDSLAILGESGSGKSTLLHILAGLEAPCAGCIRLQGIDYWQTTESQRKQLQRQQIGLVFQAFYLLPHLSAEHNVALPWLLDGQKPDRLRIDALLDRMGLRHRQHAKPAELSGGEQQRVAIARALALRPPLLLADEPTGNLDSRNASEVLDLLLEQAHEDKHALIMVTHSTKAALRMRRAVKLDEGQLKPVMLT